MSNIEFQIAESGSARLYGRYVDVMNYINSVELLGHVVDRKHFGSGSAVLLKLNADQLSALALDMRLSLPNWGKARLYTESVLAALVSESGRKLGGAALTAKLNRVALEVDADWEAEKQSWLQGQSCPLYPGYNSVKSKPITRSMRELATA